MSLESRLDFTVDAADAFSFIINNTDPISTNLEYRSGLTISFMVYEDDTEV